MDNNNKTNYYDAIKAEMTKHNSLFICKTLFDAAMHEVL